MRTCLLTTAGNAVSGVKLGLPVYSRSSDIHAEDWDAVLRWGNSAPLETDEITEINPGAKISRVCDKLEALIDLAEVVNIPTIYERLVPNGKTAVIRAMEHSQGSDFETRVGPYRIPAGKYGTELIVTSKEFRVWYAFGATKAARRTSLTPMVDHAICRSKWGYTHLETVPSVMKRETEKAFVRMGLQTGAADILWVESESKYYFLELNSAPAIDTESLEVFFRTNTARYLRSLATVSASAARR
jgi:hypothetical protein